MVPEGAYECNSYLRSGLTVQKLPRIMFDIFRSQVGKGKIVSGATVIYDLEEGEREQPSITVV